MPVWGDVDTAAFFVEFVLIAASSGVADGDTAMHSTWCMLMTVPVVGTYAPLGGWTDVVD